MPTQSLYSALLVLSDSDGLPWTTSPWQALTRVYGPPWFSTTGADPNDVSPNVPEWNVKTAQAVKTFADNVWSKCPDKQDAYAVGRHADNDSAGRIAWKEWVKGSLKKKWPLNKTVDEVLISVNRYSYNVMAIHRTRKLPTLEDSQLGDAKVALANRLIIQSLG